MVPIRTVIEGLDDPQYLRRRDEVVWWTDATSRRVVRLDPRSGRPCCHGVLNGDAPGGIGWLPDGDLLVVATGARLLLRMDGLGRVTPYAVLGELAVGSLGDVAVDAVGSAFVSDLGLRQFGTGRQRAGGQILRVDPDGEQVVVADELEVPVGLALSDGDEHLIVNEAAAARVTRFRVLADGSLGERTIVATVGGGDGRGGAAVTGSPWVDGDAGIWCVEPFDATLWRLSALSDPTGFRLPAGFAASSSVSAFSGHALVAGRWTDPGRAAVGRSQGAVLEVATVEGHLAA